MSARDDGGPAFPALAVVGDVGLSEGGLTVRDYFAAKAMQAIIAKAPFGTEEAGAQLDRQMLAARGAYAYADAMLAARDHVCAECGGDGAGGPHEDDCCYAEAKADDGWIEWKGGECPVHGCSVDVRLACGVEYQSVSALSLNWGKPIAPGRDIIAYRVVKEGGAV